MLPEHDLIYREYIGRGCVIMTAFEIVSVFIGILTLLLTFGRLIVAFLAFLTRDYEYNEMMKGKRR